jgi:hypothetical protein
MPLPKYETRINITGDDVSVRDWQLSSGELIVPAGESRDIPIGVWRRVHRKYREVLWTPEQVAAQAAEMESAAEPEPEPVAVESEPEKKPVKTTKKEKSDK